MIRATEHPTPNLPTLEPSIQLLDSNTETSQALNALAVDHVLLSAGDTCWIESGFRAQSAPFVELAPSDRILDRVQVARGFTPFQHLALLDSVLEFMTSRTELIVVPEIDGYYRNDGLLTEKG